MFAAALLILAASTEAAPDPPKTAIRVRLRITEDIVAGASESVRDIQDVLRDGDTAGNVVEAPPDSSPDLMLVVTHRFSGHAGGARRGIDLGGARTAYTLRTIIVDDRRSVPVEGRDIVWRQAAVQVVRQLGEYAREHEHGLLRRRADWPDVGFDFEPLTKEHQRELGAKGGSVIVTAVAPDGAAARAGLQAGDVIAKARGRRIERAGDLARVLYEAASGALALEVSRAGHKTPLTLSRP